MFKVTNQGMFIFISALTLILLYQLSHILTPFILGALLAYLTNPLVKMLVKRNVPHLLSVCLIFSLVMIVIFILVLTLIPVVQKQVLLLISMTPKLIEWFQNALLPWLKDSSNTAMIKTTLTNTLSKAGWLLEAMLASSYAVVGWIVNIVLTPIVFFYFLRDWDSICRNCRNILPTAFRPTILKLVEQSDEVLSAFFRGQFLVMLSLMIIYGVGLTLAGLNVGFTVGLTGGLLSIVPYLGSTFVLVTSSIMAYVQYGSIQAIIGVLIVFVIGQSLEGYVLTPFLIGKRIGLHPVVVIFAILAGGTLCGFFGVLIALPVTAVIKVLLRFALRRS